MDNLVKVAILLQLTSAIVGMTMGILVLLNNKKATLNRTFFALCFSVSIWYLGFCAMQFSKNPLVWAKLGHLGPIWVAAFYIHFIVAYLRLKRQFLLRGYYVFCIISSFCNIMDKSYFIGIYQYQWGIYPKGEIVTLIDLTMLLVMSCYGLFLLIFNLRNNNFKSSIDTNRDKYITLALAVFLLAAIDYLPKYHINIYPLGFIPFLIFASTVTYAILKYQLLSINVFIRRGLIYSMLIAIITATYLLFVIVAERFLHSVIGYSSYIGSLVASFLIAVGFIPLRNKIQYFIDKLFYKKAPGEIEQENIRLKEELERTERLRSIGTLAAGMAHEIKNPLTSIKTFTEYLPKEYDNPEFRNKFNRIVGAEVQRIDNIVRNILNFSKPRDILIEKVSIQKALDEILELLNNEFLKKKISVKKNYNLNGEFVKGDYNQIKQAFLNIILNSMEAMSGGGELTVETGIVGHELHISVSDTGIGIAEADLRHIFDPFFTRKDEGTGLGLAVVYGIIERHKGKIEVKSEKGKGVIFGIKFPINYE